MFLAHRDVDVSGLEIDERASTEREFHTPVLTHLVVEDDTAIRYCRDAAVGILDRAQADLNALRQQLGI